ncbi:MAG: hypothetical protein WDO24_24315 [Pseudomonadota bacterium]
MATANAIAQAIENKRGTSAYSVWRIGITDNWSKRKQEWSDQGEDVSHFSAWEADSSSVSKTVEAHFINKGMKGGTGGTITAATKYVYVF